MLVYGCPRRPWNLENHINSWQGRHFSRFNKIRCTVGSGRLQGRLLSDVGVDLRSLGVILDVLGASLLEVDF